jgi:SNF2 family DNA or RNA helicase
VGRVLVVVPKSLRVQWCEAIYHWLPYARITENGYEEPADGELLFFVCHYEWARTTEQLVRLRKKPFDMMIVDECHKLKSPGSKQSRRLALIGESTRYRIGLTGSPMESNEIDFWAQMRFVDSSLFGKSFAHFKKQWTRPEGYMGYNRVILERLRDKFLHRIANHSYQIEKQTALDLPPVTDMVIPISLEGKQRTAYRQMEKEMLIEWKDVVIPAALVVTQMIRLQQVTGGYVTDEDGVDHMVGRAKIDALQDVLQGHREPIIIFCRFTWEIRAVMDLVQSLQRKLSVISGKIKIGDHRKFDVLVSQVALMQGLDGIQEICSTGVFYSKGFSKTQLEQCKGRLDRSGQKKNKVTFIHLIARNTIDEDLETALKTKSDTIVAVLKQLRDRYVEER